MTLRYANGHAYILRGLVSPLVRLKVFAFYLEANNALRAFFLAHAPFFLISLVLVTVFCLANAYGDSLWRVLRRRWIVFAVATAFAGGIFALVPVRLKVLSDETNLLSVSETIARSSRAGNIIEGFYEANGHLHVLTEQTPTRPLLFPFLTACLHWARGINPSNVFVLNFLLTVALLATLWIALPENPWWAGAGLCVLLATNPIFSTNVTSGGFDLCSVVFAAWTFIAFRLYLRRPETARLAALVFVALCFANVRYESLVILPFLLGAIIFLRGRAVWAERTTRWIFMLAFALVLPALLQRYLTWGRFENPAGKDPFNVLYIFPHAASLAWLSLVSWSSAYPFLPTWAGLWGLGLSCARGARLDRAFWISVAVYGGLMLALVLAHHAGDPYAPTQVRLFLPFTVLLTWAAVAWTARVPRRGAWILGAIIGVQVPCSLWSMGHEPPLVPIRMALETEELRARLPELYPAGSVFAYERPGQLVSLGISGILQKSLVTHHDQLRQALADGRFPKIYDVKSFEGLQLVLNKLEPIPGWRRTFERTIWKFPNYRLDVYELSPEPTASESPRSGTR